MDLTGSGIETMAHPQENGGIVILFCAAEGPSKISSGLLQQPLSVLNHLSHRER